MNYFDYRHAADEAGIPGDKLAELAKLIRAEFPFDEMMYELHLLRACRAIRDGYVTLEEALKKKEQTGKLDDASPAHGHRIATEMI